MKIIVFYMMHKINCLAVVTILESIKLVDCQCLSQSKQFYKIMKPLPNQSVVLPPYSRLHVLNVYKVIIRNGGYSCPELLCTWQLVVKGWREPQPLHHVSEEDAQLVLCQRVSNANSSPNAEGHHLWKIFLNLTIFDKPFRFKCGWLLPE